MLLETAGRGDQGAFDLVFGQLSAPVYGMICAVLRDPAQAEEVTQDVFVRVGKTIQDFESNPKKGSFRGWLMNLTRWRVMDKLRSRPQVGNVPQAHSAEDRTRTVERIPDPKQEGDLWENEWQNTLLEAAMQRLSLRAQAKHFQVFDLHVRQQWSVLRVSRELEINPASIYLIIHRLTKLLKLEISKLKKTMD